MSSKRLTKQNLIDIVEYLQRVVPRGQAEADHLFRLLALLNEIVDSR